MAFLLHPEGDAGLVQPLLHSELTHAVRLYLTTCVQSNYGTMLMGMMRMKDEQIAGKAAKEVAEVTLAVPRWAGMSEAFAPLAPPPGTPSLWCSPPGPKHWNAPSPSMVKAPCERFENRTARFFILFRLPGGAARAMMEPWAAAAAPPKRAGRRERHGHSHRGGVPHGKNRPRPAAGEAVRLLLPFPRPPEDGPHPQRPHRPDPSEQRPGADRASVAGGPEMVKTAIENGQDLIVEGCYIPFDWARDFSERYLAHIRYRCLVMSEGYIRAHYGDILAHACDAERRTDDDCTLEGLLRDNAQALEACRRHGAECIFIDQHYPIDFEKEAFSCPAPT